MEVFDYDNYKNYINDRIKQSPKGGRGQLRNMAEHLKVHTTMMSHIFRGDKDLNLEQASLICEYLGFNDLEVDYFLALVSLDRAGNQTLRKAISRQLDSIKKKYLEIQSRIVKSKKLSFEASSTFYSSWIYTAIRQLSNISGGQSDQSIADALKLPMKTVNKALGFLKEQQLCTEENGYYRIGAKQTHIAADSPLVINHHTNWRLKSLEKNNRLSDSEMMFTAPLTISEADSVKIKKHLLDFIKKIDNTVKKTKPQKLSCLNIDWVDIAKP